jgi:hypothetical protein
MKDREGSGRVPTRAKPLSHDPPVEPALHHFGGHKVG